MSPFEQQVVSQIDGLLQSYTDAGEEGKAQNQQPDIELWTKRFLSAIERFAPANSNYLQDLDTPRKFAAMERSGLFRLFGTVMNTLKALRDDYAAGYMRTIAEMIHGDVFSDFLEMADYLNTSKYPVAAAVIAGTVLEEHVRKLCDKNNVSRTGTNGKPKTIDTMNVDLAKAGIYGKPMQMQVTAWYAMRNAAAHGTMAASDYPNVPGMITGINGFLAMYPA